MTPNPKSLTVIGILAIEACEILFSRARHDFHYDSLGKVAVDGGFDYLKICGDGWKIVQIDLRPDITETDLYQDWNRGADKYGIHKIIDIGKKDCPVLGWRPSEDAFGKRGSVL